MMSGRTRGSGFSINPLKSKNNEWTFFKINYDDDDDDDDDDERCGLKSETRMYWLIIIITITF